MNSVEECYDLTVELIATLENLNTNNRDQIIETVNNLLAKRAEIISILEPPFSPNEVEIGEKIVQLNKHLSLLLNKTKQEIQKDMNGIPKKKTSMERYINPYSKLQTDGFFYDKRK